MRSWHTLLTILVAALVLSSGGAGAEPLKVRQGWVSMTNVLSPLVFQKKDVLKHYGKTYVVEPTRFKGTSAELTAIASGQVDIITLGYSTLGAAIENAHLDDLRVVADGFQDGVDDYLSSPYIVRNGSGIKTVEDLKGKVLAVNVVGGAVDLALRAMLREHHMDGTRDVSIIEAAFPAMNAMLLEGKVDLITSVPPFTYDPKLQANAHSLFTMKDAMGPTQMIVLAAREEFMQKNRAAMTDYFEDMLRGSRWFLDPANREQAIKIVADVTKQPASHFAIYLFTRKDYYHAPDGIPNLTSLQHAIETQRKLGFLKTDLDVKKYSDLGPVEDAAKRLQ